MQRQSNMACLAVICAMIGLAVTAEYAALGQTVYTPPLGSGYGGGMGTVRYAPAGAGAVASSAWRALPSEARYGQWTSGMLPSEVRYASSVTGSRFFSGAPARIVHPTAGTIRYAPATPPAASPYLRRVSSSGLSPYAQSLVPRSYSPPSGSVLYPTLGTTPYGSSGAGIGSIYPRGVSAPVSPSYRTGLGTVRYGGP
jgi:hypothetical protein